MVHSPQAAHTHREAEQPAVGWQPIETAPRDGTAILIAATQQATRDWSEFEDDLSDAIGDSLDMDWTSRDGAGAVVRWLNENAPRKLGGEGE